MYGRQVSPYKDCAWLSMGLQGLYNPRVFSAVISHGRTPDTDPGLGTGTARVYGKFMIACGLSMPTAKNMYKGG